MISDIAKMSYISSNCIISKGQRKISHNYDMKELEDAAEMRDIKRIRNQLLEATTNQITNAHAQQEE